MVQGRTTEARMEFFSSGSAASDVALAGFAPAVPGHGSRSCSVSRRGVPIQKAYEPGFVTIRGQTEPATGCLASKVTLSANTARNGASALVRY